MIRRVVIVLLVFLAFTSLAGLMVSFVRPTYEVETERLLGDPARASRLWLVLEDGVFRVKHGCLVEGSQPRSARGVDWGVFAFASVGFHNQGAVYRLRTVTVSLWLLLVAFAFYPVLVLVRGPLRWWWFARRGRCERCGYDLTGNVSGVCPECGRRLGGGRL